MAENELDANEVINKLSQRIAGLSRELAIQQVYNDGLQEVIDKQKTVIDSYEEKDDVEKGNAQE